LSNYSTPWEKEALNEGSRFVSSTELLFPWLESLCQITHTPREKEALNEGSRFVSSTELLFPWLESLWQITHPQVEGSLK
jgi:hypothetical protein